MRDLDQKESENVGGTHPRRITSHSSPLVPGMGLGRGEGKGRILPELSVFQEKVKNRIFV